MKLRREKEMSTQQRQMDWTRLNEMCLRQIGNHARIIGGERAEQCALVAALAAGYTKQTQ